MANRRRKILPGSISVSVNPRNVTDLDPPVVQKQIDSFIQSDEAELSNLLTTYQDEDVIVMHPGFRMFVLANRPGFPFLGNDFFAAMGALPT